ncbi:MAG: hypothetical protein IT165_26385, partial [Bryobacterales bacterium]|nr:hypothetical protein [Bryobacterales bacterium]
AFVEHHKVSIQFSYRCFDRLLLNGLIQPFQQPERVLGFFNAYREGKRVTRKTLTDIADQFQYWLKNRSTKWDAAILEAPEGDDSRRDRLLDPYFENAQPNQVVAIVKAREPARILVAIGDKNNDSPHLEYKQRWVNQFNFYLQDARWGRMFVRMCPYFPFSARVCLNQHHWLAIRMREEGIEFQQSTNAFLKGGNPARLQELADSLTTRDLLPCGQKWLAFTPFITDNERRHAGCQHRLFFAQVEYCDNLIFHRRAAIEERTQRLLDLNRNIGQPKKITTIFGRKVTKEYMGKLQSVIEDLDLPNPVIRSHYDDTLRQGLAVELRQSPFLSLLPDARIQQSLSLMGQPKDARLTPEIALQLCERTGSAAILEGSIASVGSEYVLGLRARNCNTGSVLDQEQIQAAKREDVLNSLSQIARRFRIRVGESLATVEKHSAPLAEVTTPVLEAFQAYNTALKGILHGGTTAAIPLFRRAVEIDPQFATAWAHLGFAYSTFGRSVLAAECTTKAWKLRDRVSQPERFFIDFLYERQVTGNLEKAYQTLELWHQTYPREEEIPSPRGLIGGISTHGTGRFERAIEASQKLIAANPDSHIGYGSLASSLFFLGRFAEAESALQQADERKLEPRDDLVIRYNIAVLKGDKDQMDRVLARAKGKHRAEHRVAHAEALALARSGRLRAARLSSRRAVDLLLQEGAEARELAAAYQAARAVWEALCGNSAEGQNAANAAVKLTSGRDVQYAAGLALALSGHASRSEALAADLEKRFPEDTFVKFTYAPVLHALAELRQGKPADAVERLEIARQYELAANGLSFNFYLGGLHSAYVRGEAFLSERRYAEAAAEFQNILAHRGIVGLDPIGAVAHLQLGRVYRLSGDNAKAKSEYLAFLRLWKDADAGISILQQAKAEFARLR